VHKLLSLCSNYKNLNGINKIKFPNAQYTKAVVNYKNTKEELHKSLRMAPRYRNTQYINICHKLYFAECVCWFIY